MPSYTVNASTSLVLVDSSVLTAGDSAIVYLSSAMTPGQVVTVRDSLGYLSSPQAITVSTTAGIQFMDGTSSLQISQPFASLSFSAQNASNWNIINTFGFPLYNTVANVITLTTSNLIGNSLSMSDGISTNAITANQMTIQSTAQVLGPAFVSSLIVNGAPPFSMPTGIDAYINGSALVGSNVGIGGSLTVGQAAQFQSSMTVQGSLGVGGQFIAGGNVLVQGNLTTVGAGTFNAQSLNLMSSMTILGPAIFNSNVTVQSNLDVFQTATLSNLTTSTASINTGAGGYLQLGQGSGPQLRARTDVLVGQTVAAWNAPVFAPYISSGAVQATNTITTGNLVVTGSISAPTVTQFLLSSAQIQNNQGSLTVSSLTANVLSLSNTLTVQTFGTSTFQASTAIIAGNLTITTAPTGYLSAASIVASTMNVVQISSSYVNAGTIITPALRLSSLYVNQTIDGGTSFSSMTVPNAFIDNSQGSINTSSLYTNALIVSTVTFPSGVIQSANPIYMVASTVAINNAFFSTATASSLQVSTVTATRITVGAPLTAGSNGPYFDYTASPTPSTNVLITGGPGDYLSPYFLSNVKPVGQNPAVPYQTAISFVGNYGGLPVPPGLLIEYTATLFWANQVNSQLAITGGPTLYGTSGANQTFTSTSALSSFGINASLYGNSAVSVQFKFRYTPNANSIDSNTVVEFNNGRLYWNYALNGTTIQNSLNDINTRNLYYYGSLNFASDPRIKENIQDADLDRCYDIIGKIPLRNFRYNSAYCSTFRVEPSSRLGFLATELGALFPKSVHPSDIDIPGIEGPDPLMTIDTAQVEMAHIGATKALMAEVERLEAAVSTLSARLPAK